jgi:hypothetical protein
MENEDLMDVALKQFTAGQETENKKDDIPEQVIDTSVDKPVEQVEEKVEQQVIDPPADIPMDKLLAKFNELSGTNFDNLDKIKDFADKYNKYPELEKQLEVMPELLDIMEKIQNPLNYFKDETAFKVNELSKDAKFAGKEILIDKILRGNLSTANDVDVIAIATQLKAKDGVRNPLRAELKSMGLDPDEVLDNYADLDDDTKDLLKIKADQYRDELPKIGDGINVPTIQGTALERVLNEKKAYKEDLAARKEKLIPLSESIVSQIKDLKVTSDFSFKLDLTPQQVKEYAAELADVVVSGQYDLNTEEGKQQVYGAMVDMFKIDYFDKIVTALANAKTSQTEEDARRRFNNEKPLDKKEPNPIKDETEKHPMQRAAEEMISRGY